VFYLHRAYFFRSSEQNYRRKSGYFSMQEPYSGGVGTYVSTWSRLDWRGQVSLIGGDIYIAFDLQAQGKFIFGMWLPPGHLQLFFSMWKTDRDFQSNMLQHKFRVHRGIFFSVFCLFIMVFYFKFILVWMCVWNFNIIKLIMRLTPSVKYLEKLG